MKKKFNVLIIDDAFFIRGLIKKAIGAKKIDSCIFEVLAEATNGKEGLDLYKISCPDVVTVDINMPKLNGLELITEIKKINPNAQIIVISSNIDLKLQQSISKMGVHFLHKPFIENDIWSKLDLISEEVSNVSNDSKELSQDKVPTTQKAEIKFEENTEQKIEEIKKTQEQEPEIIDINIVNLNNTDAITATEIANEDEIEIEDSITSVTNNDEVTTPKKKKKKKKKKNMDTDSFLEVGAIPSTMFSQYVDNKKNNNENSQYKKLPISEPKKISNKIDSFLTNDTISIPIIPKIDKQDTINNKTSIVMPSIKKEDTNSIILEAENVIPINNKYTKTQTIPSLPLVKDKHLDKISPIKEKLINDAEGETLLVIVDEPKTLVKENIVLIEEESISVPSIDDISLVEDKPVVKFEEELQIIEDEPKDNNEILLIEEESISIPSIDDISLIEDKPTVKFEEELQIIEDEPKDNKENIVLIEEESISIPSIDDISLIEDKPVVKFEEELQIIEDEPKDNNEILLTKEESISIPSIDDISLIEDKPVVKFEEEPVDNTENEILFVIADKPSNFNNKTVSLNIDKKPEIEEPQSNESLSDIESELLTGMSYNLQAELDLKAEEDLKKEEAEKLDNIFKDLYKSDEDSKAVVSKNSEEDLRKQKLDELDMVLENLDSFNFDNEPTDVIDTNNDTFNVHNLNMFGNKDLMAQTSLNNPDKNYHTSNTHDSASKMELNRGTHNYNTTNSAKTVIVPPKNNQLTQIHSEKLKNNYGVIVEPEKEEVEKNQSGGFFAKLFNLFKNKKHKNSKGEK